MVAYVKNNFLLVPIIVLLLFVVSSYARFSTKVTKDEISDICTQKDRDINELVCFEVLESIPGIATRNHSDLAKFLIKYDSQKFSDMMKQFQSLENSTTDRSSKGSYHVCSETSDLAIGCFDTALTSLANKDYLTLYYNVGCTMTMAGTCRDELSTVVKANPQLFKDISFVRDVAFIVLMRTFM
ncbi:PREDICTED: uncharacterized protein LOC104752561 [Camelina sativa]|uniref:Uncharacterized protein LOC104752561 n=1 Tax=Camelina sativa TaxID=90675 RepID=A0ABM0WM25_CAMSA|nr:PREDICTED: uncharacterized protein LOC104752561 [Camelina sativa]